MINFIKDNQTESIKEFEELILVSGRSDRPWVYISSGSKIKKLARYFIWLAIVYT